MSQWSDRMCIYIYILGEIFRGKRFSNFTRFGRYEISQIYAFHALPWRHTARKHSNRRDETTEKDGRRREREREGDSSNQIHRDSSGHACRSGCTTLYRRLSSPPLDPIPPPRLNTPARLPPSRSFALLSMQLGLLPSCLHLIGPRVYTRCLGHV